MSNFTRSCRLRRVWWYYLVITTCSCSFKHFHFCSWVSGGFYPSTAHRQVNFVTMVKISIYPILETVDMVKMLVRQGPRPSPPTILATLSSSFNFQPSVSNSLFLYSRKIRTSNTWSIFKSMPRFWHGNLNVTSFWDHDQHSGVWHTARYRTGRGITL